MKHAYVCIRLRARDIRLSPAHEAPKEQPDRNLAGNPTTLTFTAFLFPPCCLCSPTPTGRRSCRRPREADAEHENAGTEDVDAAEAVVDGDGKYRRSAVPCTKAEAPEELTRSSRDVVAAAARFIVPLVLCVDVPAELRTPSISVFCAPPLCLSKHYSRPGRCRRNHARDSPLQFVCAARVQPTSCQASLAPGRSGGENFSTLPFISDRSVYPLDWPLSTGC